MCLRQFAKTLLAALFERYTAIVTPILVVCLIDERRCLAKQLRRASPSIPLNIAEGAGEYSRPDKARFYRMALRSATECAAIFDVARRIELAPAPRCDASRELLLRIVSMLTKMARAMRD